MKAKFQVKQTVNTPFGDAIVFAATNKVINVKYLHPKAEDPLYGKYYENPTYEHQKSISQLHEKD